MQRERVSENVFWFQSEIYAQVTAGVVAGPQWAVVIDTLAIPEETLAMRDFIEEELKVPVRYIINTHHHADHSWGNCFFPGAAVIAHTKCRQAIIERGPSALEAARRQNAIFRQIKLIPPQITFDHGNLSLRVGKKISPLWLLPDIRRMEYPFWSKKTGFCLPAMRFSPYHTLLMETWMSWDHQSSELARWVSKISFRGTGISSCAVK